MVTMRFGGVVLLGLVSASGACGKKDGGDSGAPLVTFPPPLDLTVRADTEDQLRINFDGADGNTKQPVVSLKTGKIIGGDAFGPNDKFVNMFLELKGHPHCRFFVGPVKEDETFAKAVADLEGEQPVPGLARFKAFVKKEEQPGGWILNYTKAMGDSITQRNFNLVKTIGGKRYTCNTYTDADADGQKCIDAVAQVCGTLDAKK